MWSNALQAFRECGKRKISPSGRIERVLRAQQGGPGVAQQQQKVAHFGPVFRERAFHEPIDVVDVGTLCLNLVEKSGKSVGMRNGLREGEVVTAFRCVPAAHQGCEKQPPTQRCNRGRKIDCLGYRVESGVLVVGIAERLELRKKRCAAKHACK